MPVADAAAIVGEWRVAGTTDRALDLPHGMMATITPATIRIVSQCKELNWSYRLARGVVRMKPFLSSKPPCLRESSLEEFRVERAMNGARNVRRHESGALVFSGSAGSVSLFTQ